MATFEVFFLMNSKKDELEKSFTPNRLSVPKETFTLMPTFSLTLSLLVYILLSST